MEVLESGFQLGMTCPQPHQMDRSAVIGGLFFDLFGLVVLPLHTVYIVPKSSMNGRIKAYVYPENPDSAGLLETYREAWGVL